MTFNYSFELHDFDEALTPYGTLETRPPELTTTTIEDFTDGDHFRTGVDSEKHLILQLEDRLITILLDESGSMTWNDNSGDRYTYLKRLLSKLDATYPGSLTANLIGFGGVPTTTSMFITQGGSDFLTDQGLSFSQFLQQTFQDSIFDFAGVRVIRRDDRFPTHPADGIVVADGIFEAAKDDTLEENKQYYYGIWTFNKNQHFSQGRFVKGVPRDRILPAGVNYATATPRILPGVVRDQYTQLIYNFQEKDGYVVFDSSGLGNHGTIGSETVLENFWSGDSASSSHEGEELKKPVGVRFDGSFDIIEASNTSETSIIGVNNESYHGLTVNLWIYRYTQSNHAWIIGSSTTAPSNSVGWAFGLLPNGKLGVKIDSDISDGFEEITGSPVVPLRSWTMATFVINTSGCCDLYINSNLSVASFCPSGASGSIDTTDDEKIYIGAKPTDSGAAWNGIDYFGSLAQVSISNTTRDQAWVTSTYDQELQIFNQTINDANQIPPDNRQREVLLSWQISEDFNYENGSVKVIRKYREIPSNDTDGDEVIIQSASSGDFFFIDATDFIHNTDYYYRIFTYNSIGNPCDRQESRVLPVRIQRSDNSDPSNALGTVSDENIIIGDKKLLLQWDNSTDTRIRGTRIYFGDERFPTIRRSAQGDLEVSDGVEIADTTSTMYIHRVSGRNCDGSDIPLANGKAHYYTIVSYDELNRLSEPVFLLGIPSSASTVVFPPQEIDDLHLIIVNPETLSIKWKNPTLRTSKLELYLGETALVFVSIRDIYGGTLDDLDNIELKVCTTIQERGLKTSEEELSSNGGINNFDDTFNPRVPCDDAPLDGETHGRSGGQFGTPFDEDCNDEQEIAETVILSSTVESGLIKGIITHTNDRAILSRREGYIMNVRAQLKIEDPDAPEGEEKVLFKFHTQPVTVTFTHPIKITAINKRHKFFAVGCEVDGEARILNDVCSCNEALDQNPCQPQTYNGGYVGATQPYVCRIEIQYKGEALPDGTPINVQLFKHEDGNPLAQKSDRTFIREGRYLTTAVLEEEINGDGTATGNFVSKSICDIEIPHPYLPDWVDVYASLDFAGFLVDAVHEVRFISSLFIRADISRPFPDGVDVAEQFAAVWQLNPDDPFNVDSNIPVPDGTLVKWELIQGRHGRDRPFYSTEQLPVLISGIYSITVSGVARNVFFGPVGNLERHIENLTCRAEDGSIVSAESCCLAEEYEIHASVILQEKSARDAVKFAYECEEDPSLTNKRFLMNAAESQPGSNPHWITWADGTHLLKFQIAKTPAISTIMGASCFRQCVEAQVGGQLFTFPEEQIIQVTAPGEILWDVVFQEDPYTAEVTPLSYQSVSPPDDEYGSLTTANIPLSGETTDFYLRLNKFVDSANPKPVECEGGGGGGGLGGGGEADPCEWRNICNGISVCSPTTGRPWQNVEVVSGTTTLIANNREVTLFGGGDYENGIPPIYAGFKEPLDVRIVEARINGARVSELVVDSVSTHTFVVEVTFAGEPVPDGTRVSILVEGEDQDIVILSSNSVYTQQINDPLINPTGDLRSLAFFSIEPLPNVAFTSRINVTCNYDKLGTVTRAVTRCIEVSNTVNEEPPSNVPPGTGDQPVEGAATSNEEIVYDTIEDIYTTTSASQVRRLGHFVSAAPLNTIDLIYHFGGFTGGGDAGTSNITPLSEVFNINTETWQYTTDMPTPRCFGMTVGKDETIYCIGGVEVDQLLSQHTVSRKIEAFDIITETWNTTLTPMPEDYGVAYGDAQVVGDYIYITCGITTIIDNSKPGELNDKILRYSIPQDSWEIITPSDSVLYKRMSQFGFYRDATNHSPSSTITGTTIAGDDGHHKLSTDTWIVAGALTFGNTGGSNFDVAFRWPVNLPENAEIISATLRIPVTLSTGDGTFQSTVNLLDLDDASQQTWSSGGPINTDYSASISLNTTVSGSQTLEIDVTNLALSFTNRQNYRSGNYIGLKMGWEGDTNRSYTIAEATTILNITYEIKPKRYYIYGGSIPKSPEQIEIERTAIVNDLLNQFRSFILTSTYYLNLSTEEQQQFIEDKEAEIRNSVQVPAFIYPITGFKFNPGSEAINSQNVLEMDIGDTLDDEWTVLPKPRDMGRCVYIPHQDTAYFLGGSNQNNSTTLNRVEAIDLTNGNLYDRRRPLSRGRSMFGAVYLGDEIYISGGLTSGHKEGWVEIEVQQLPEFVEAMGTQSCGMMLTLKNDSGEVIEDEIRVDVRGKARIPAIDDILIEYTANRAADRALGGDGSGNATDLPEAGDEIDLERLREAQNSIIDPNSDQFQFNAARKLSEEVSLFPVLYSRNDFFVNSGIGGTTLLPRSEDPLADFEKLAEFIDQLVQNTPSDPDERFSGDLTREELIALGDVLETVDAPTIVVNSGALRELYDIETIVTILDTFYFGQTTSDFDVEVQQRINDRIEELLTPPPPEDGEEGGGTDGGTDGTGGGSGAGGGAQGESDCFVLQHSAQPDIPAPDTPPSSPDPDNPAGTGGFSQSGQCLFCESILPLNVDIRGQNPTVLTKFFNATDWLPQIKRRIVEASSLRTVIDELDTIDHEIPFGSSQLFDAMVEAATITAGETFDDVKKVIYIASDSSQNLSISTRSEAIEEVNSIDGDKNTPCIYTVFSTSFPLSLSTLLDRSEVGDVAKITEETGGQSTTLISSGFLDQILNLALGSATGGLGYGIYTRRLNFGELSAITSITTDFDLPVNTQGYVRFRHSKDGYNFGDFSERFESSGTFDFVDFFAKVVDFEVVLTTGFAVDITEEYDAVPTGIPKLLSIAWEHSAEREDFIFLDKEDVLTNAQQVAMAFEGTIPESSIVEIGAATSESHNWNDFQSQARPAIEEFGKMFILERDEDVTSIVPNENLTTIDNILYKTTYGPWDPTSLSELFYVSGDVNIPVLTGFKFFPREGEVYFDTRQPPDRQFKLIITNDDQIRVGVRLRNRLHTDAIVVEGVGFIYSTNNERPPALAQVAPSALNVAISPTNPNAGDTFLALYNYRDLNNNPESGTIISWYRNGIQLLEIQNRLSWTNNDLLLSHKLVPNDRLQFAVTPSDGRDYGSTIFSPAVVIQARQPGAENIRLVPIRNGVPNDRFDTSSTFKLEYTFSVEDAGAGSVENGTTIKWLVNGVVFKEGTFTQGEDDPYFDPKSIEPTEIISGTSAHIIGNQIQVEITPRTLTIAGPTVRSSVVTVENSRPIATDVQIQPLLPNTQSTLSVTYRIDDRDITIEAQTDRTEIKWFSSPSGSTTFTEVTELRNEDTVPPFYLRAGERWKAEIKPFDGLDLGPTVGSNVLQINP